MTFQEQLGVSVGRHDFGVDPFVFLAVVRSSVGSSSVLHVQMDLD